MIACKQKAFVINANTETHRWETMQTQLEHLNMHIERVEAIMGKQLSQDERLKWYSPEKNKRQFHMELLPGEIGCYASHITAWQKIVSEQLEWALILEDDAIIDSEMNRCLELLNTRVNFETVDMIKLRGRPEEQLGQTWPVDDKRIVSYVRIPSCMTAYILTAKGARKMLLDLPPFGRPVDLDIGCWWEFDLNVIGMTPYPVRSNPTHPTTIGKRSTKGFNERIKRWYQRFEYKRRAKIALTQQAWQHNIFFVKFNLKANKMQSISYSISRWYYRIRGKQWIHNKMFNPAVAVHRVSEQSVQFSYKGRSWVLPDASVLQDTFENATAHILLSGPSIKSIQRPNVLARHPILAVNGSPRFCIEHNINYEIYVVDDPFFVKTMAQDLIAYASKAKYCFLSYRSILGLILQGFDLSNLPIYVFEYKFAPFRKPLYEPVGPFFSRKFENGLNNKSDTVAYLALQICYAMGFRNIALFGLDLNLSGRFYYEKNPQPQAPKDRWDERIASPFKLIRDMVHSQEWNVVNYSPNSELDHLILAQSDPNHYLAGLVNP